jgi:hypothetical protein
MTTFTADLGFKIGDIHQLETGKDWTFKFPPGKRHTALVGLAIDRRIKRLLSLRHELDILVPLSQYAPYDLMYRGQHIEIKSFSKKTVSISERETVLARQVFLAGGDMLYMLFEQVAGGREYEEIFVFHGYVSYSALIDANELKDSTLDSGSYFWIANVAGLLFD